SGHIFIDINDPDPNNTSKPNRLTLAELTSTPFKAKDPSKARKALSTLKSLLSRPDGKGLGGFGILLPLFSQPVNLLKLLTGKPADLIQWDIPRLDLAIPFSTRFGPLIPPIPLFATVGVTFNAFLDLSLGFDSRGLLDGNFLDGFYFGDREDVTTGPDIAEF